MLVPMRYVKGGTAHCSVSGKRRLWAGATIWRTNSRAWRGSDSTRRRGRVSLTSGILHHEPCTFRLQSLRGARCAARYRVGRLDRRFPVIPEQQLRPACWSCWGLANATAQAQGPGDGPIAATPRVLAAVQSLRGGCKGGSRGCGDLGSTLRSLPSEREA